MKLAWTKLAWLNEDLLQIDATDTTYATTVYGSDDGVWAPHTVASGSDCVWTRSRTGVGVIDLRGTPYIVAGANDTPCSKSSATSSVCFQWKSTGYYSAVSVTCSHGNQRCVVRCGGYCGACKLIDNILQLAWASPSPPPSPPPYYTLMSDALSWDGANAACLAAGLQLATVQSAAQKALLLTAAAGNSVWIGGTDAASEGVWVWSPSNTPLSYTNWNTGEPNNQGGAEDCMIFQTDGTWNDGTCSAKIKYVCQQTSWNVIVLAESAPTDDPAVGVLVGADGAREVFFKPVPNDGSLDNNGNGQGASALEIRIVAPHTGDYHIQLTDRAGSWVFSNTEGSACRSSHMAGGQTDSFFLCSSDPRSSATNPDTGTPDVSSCFIFGVGNAAQSVATFPLSEGTNSLWLANREVCTLASLITITAV